jgi:ABC-type maltose transport system permease subunit
MESAGIHRQPHPFAGLGMRPCVDPRAELRPFRDQRALFVMPVIILFFLAQRAFIEGVTLTGTKG